MSAPELDEPLVYEHAYQGWHAKPQPYKQAFMEWMREHDIEPADTISIAVHLVDSPFARVVQFVKDDNGKPTYDMEREEPITLTVTVPLSSLPPAPAA